MKRIFHLCRAARLVTARRGTMSIYAAVIIPVLLGMTSLGSEYAYGLMTQSLDQRVADVAAYSGALAYNATASAQTVTTSVNRIATLNGLATSAMSSSLVNSPTNDGNQAVQVIVTTSTPLILAQVLGGGSTLPVAATAYVEMKGGAPACVVALSSSGSGVTLSGGTSLSAAACAVGSNASVSVPCGTTITTLAVLYNGSTPSQPCTGISAPSGKTLSITKKSSSDPLTGNSTVSAARTALASIPTTSPSAPTVSGGNNINFSYVSIASIQALMPSGCTAGGGAPTWTVTCTAGGTYTFGNITLGGGITLNFDTAATGTSTYKFNGGINGGGSAMNFGPGTYIISQGITTNGGSTTTFGNASVASSYTIGASTSSCGSGTYSICNVSTLTFNGPSSFTLSSGIDVTGGATLTMGSSTAANSYTIGASSNGDAITMGGGAKLFMNSSTVSATAFTLNGNLDVGSGGGSCLTIPQASAHNINGTFTTAGGVTLGSGVYYVNGYVGLGASGGGDVTCNGSTVGVSGSNVTFVISGSSTPSSGSCSGQLFCVAAGFSNVTLTAPTATGGTDPDQNLLVVGPASGSAGASFAEGASNTTMSGAFYVPSGAISLSGGSSVGSGAGQCLELIGSQVTLSGGATAATACSGLGGSGAVSTALLVQ